jgi:hypothetical protein
MRKLTKKQYDYLIAIGYSHDRIIEWTIDRASQEISGKSKFPRTKNTRILYRNDNPIWMRYRKKSNEQV